MGRQVPELTRSTMYSRPQLRFSLFFLLSGVNPSRYSFLGWDILCITEELEMIWKRTVTHFFLM